MPQCHLKVQIFKGHWVFLQEVQGVLGDKAHSEEAAVVMRVSLLDHLQQREGITPPALPSRVHNELLLCKPTGINATGKGRVHIVPNKHEETLLVFIILSLILHLFYFLPAVAQKPFDSNTSFKYPLIPYTCCVTRTEALGLCDNSRVRGRLLCFEVQSQDTAALNRPLNHHCNVNTRSRL